MKLIIISVTWYLMVWVTMITLAITHIMPHGWAQAIIMIIAYVITLPPCIYLINRGIAQMIREKNARRQAND